ncbi:MAG: helix-turn-helix transcriptional regulator [Rhodobiaceae bacterium]|nr:helix-turn-helix transcriptional regulator [Rhodobiaceae bacterium]
MAIKTSQYDKPGATPIGFKTDIRIPTGVALLMAVQLVCVVIFLNDVIDDARELMANGQFPFHISIEAVAVLSLFAAIVVESRFLVDLLRRKAHLERSLKIASAAVHDVINAHFEEWKLSPSETDVATFLVKGLEISEIAQMRGCAEGTVKAHLNAIYRKSGTRRRGELLSVIIDSLLAGNVQEEAVVADRN